MARLRVVNRKFADAALVVARADDLICVHDYQLLLVPAMIRERLPDARVRFFLHIPFRRSRCSASCLGAVVSWPACSARM
jgi:trehalose-6-phosphate synthase